MNTCTLTDGEFPDSMNAIVRVGAEDKGAAFRKGKGLSNEFQCASGVGGKDDGVSWWSPEEREDGLTGLRSLPQNEWKKKNSRVINRMGVTKNMALKEGRVDTNKALGVQGSTHVVNVGFAGTIEPGKVASSKRVEDPSEVILRVLFDESLEGKIGVPLG
ncbi:hypothetical protein EIP86_002371 [Pleurotus ostreatoroseus]|nr:hypothetical protein EIP86_002371 [Pleurotus ostreatoroseus]